MDRMSAEARSRVMRSIRSSWTGPELAFSSALTLRPVPHFGPSSIDFAFPDSKVAVFVDGEFWHGRDPAYLDRKLNAHWCEHIAGNVARDRERRRGLALDGWVVYRLWESVVNGPRLAEVAAGIERVVRAREGISGGQGRLFKE